VKKRVQKTLRGIKEKTCETDSPDEVEQAPNGHKWDRKKVKIAKMPVTALYNEKIEGIRSKENALKLIM